MVNAERLAREIKEHLKQQRNYAVAPGYNGFPEVDWTDVANIADELPETVLMLPWQQNGKLRVLIVGTSALECYRLFVNTFNATMKEWATDPEGVAILHGLRDTLQSHYAVALPYPEEIKP